MKMLLHALGGCLLLLSAQGTLAQTFTLGTSALANTNAHSGGCMGVADMDHDGYDDVILLDQSNHLYIEYQAANGTYTSFDYGVVSSAQQWGMAAGDVGNDGHSDVFTGGNYDGAHLVRITSRGVYTNTNIDAGNTLFMQCNNIADINNDGWPDAFGCHDDGAPHIWMNNGSGTLAYNSSYINFATTPSSDMSGNYGSVWTDFDNDGDLDLYITHCRQGVSDPNDPRRWNRLFVNDGTNHYTDQAATYGLQDRHESWTTDFGDIDNDGDLDAIITNDDITIQLFKNDGTAHFTEFTTGSGLEVTGFFLQEKMEDFDNDGFLDLLTAGGDYYFHGNGNGTFTQVSNYLPHPTGTPALHSMGIGDLNHDGFIDIYASYGGGYVSPSSSHRDELYVNNGNTNHWLNFNLRGKTSNRDALGARVTLYGPWGKQIREVRGGESYGIVTSFTCHFGIGANLKADSAIVRWPSGVKDTYRNIAANQWVSVTENETHQALVALKVMLEGPFNTGTGTMGDGLRSASLIPSVQPYTALGLNLIGNSIQNLAPSILSVTGANAIVDWVWVELRDKTTPTTIVRAKVALVQRDGDVVEVDGVTPIWFGMPADQYGVAVRHRIHLGCMTATAVALSGTSATVNFTLAGTATWGTAARKDVNGTQVLWGGNSYHDTSLKYTGANNDRDPILVRVGGTVPTNSVPGYYSEDVNMDGTTRYTGNGNDRDPILVNIGGTTPTNIRAEQLP